MKKVIADTFTNAGAVLGELVEFMNVAHDMYDALQPYSKASGGRTLPRFITETSISLRQCLIEDFSMRFPNIESLVVNGEGASESSYGRLHDACYIFNDVLHKVSEANCVFTSDDSREKMLNKLANVIGDLAVFICVQFSIKTSTEEELIYRSVQEHCDKMGISVDVFYSLLLQELEDVGRSWYSYEPISPLYQSFQDYDPILFNECEEALFPLTDDLTSKLLAGTISVPAVRGMMLEFSKGTEETEVQVTPATLISQMKLK